MPFCKNCQETHPRPVGKHCKATTSNEAESTSSLMRDVLGKLTYVTDRLATIEAELNTEKQGSTCQSTQQPGTS